MCSVRCPIQVNTENNTITWIQGNPHVPTGAALCARGAAGGALYSDEERPQTPLIRLGERGEGKWKAVSWDEAFEYVTNKINAIKEQHGARSILFSDRGGPFVDLHQAFMRGLGSPNYCNHDSACARNVQHANKSISGLGRKEVVYDYKNCKHLVLQFRNPFESINIAEANGILDSINKGGKLTVIDIRASVPACKADTFHMIRPGTDYAFNLAVIHTLITENLYQHEYVAKYVQGINHLQLFIEPYTPEWAEQETGIAADAIRILARELAKAAPAVIWHPGWMTSRYDDSFYVSRTAYIINALLGAYGSKGGLAFPNSPAQVGRKGLKKFSALFTAPEDKRADGVGWRYPHIDKGPGLIHYAYDAIVTDDPYPVRGYICFRHDPLMAFPDPAALKKKWEKLDLLVSVTFSWSDTAWHSDVVLPLSTYLERESIIIAKNGLKPQFTLRQRAVPPKYDTRADWEIFTGLAKRLGISALAFDSIEDMWRYQLEDTGVSIEDFAAKGFVSLADAPLYRSMDEVTLPTPSGKLEIISEKWAKAGLPSLKPYESPQAPPKGTFRLITGRCAIHTQGHTVNNPLLYEQVPENVVWIHTQRAAELGIAQNDTIQVGTPSAMQGSARAFVTDFIHPEAVFMLHGFGHTLPVESRANGAGIADQTLMPGGLDNVDPAGGGVSMQEHYVVIRKAQE